GTVGGGDRVAGNGQAGGSQRGRAAAEGDRCQGRGAVLEGDSARRGGAAGCRGSDGRGEGHRLAEYSGVSSRGRRTGRGCQLSCGTGWVDGQGSGLRRAARGEVAGGVTERGGQRVIAHGQRRDGDRGAAARAYRGGPEHRCAIVEGDDASWR